ncbi:MAG TPA: metalloregulator ArsR/SmtB family transcription factor [Myxococcota bacterium]|nr:metalloregulator ArsR/SmtB family transcription factor [Myxococcota bacterium]
MASRAKRHTRDELLRALKRRGPQTAAQLARRVRVSPVTARLQLGALAAQGWVTFHDERLRVGRPRRIWQLAARARAAFPDAHADLAIELFDAARRAFGVDALDRLLRARSRDQLRRYRKRLPARDAPLEARVAALAKLRSEEGFMAEWAKHRDGALLLVENHCPLSAAAAVCPALCRDELALFRSALGTAAAVERLEHILAGSRRCTYRIAPATRA